MELRASSGGKRGVFDKVPGSFVLSEERLHFTAQGIVAGTELLEHPVALRLAGFERSTEDGFDFAPAFRIHVPRRCLSVRSRARVLAIVKGNIGAHGPA
jgi:hypothetical protein